MTTGLLLPVLALVGLAVSAVSVPFVRTWAQRVGLVDDPAAGDYKTHRRVTAYGGGIAIAVGVSLPALILLWWILSARPFLLWEGTGC